MIQIFENETDFIIRDLTTRSLKNPDKYVKAGFRISAGNSPDIANEYIKSLVDAGTHEVLPMADYTPHYSELRCQSKALGGYGTIEEQLEILGEKGITAFQEHIKAIKVAHPKS